MSEGNEDEQLGAVILSLPTRINSADPPHLELIVNKEVACNHHTGHVLDDEAKTVHCRCGAELTAWQSLLIVAKENKQLRAWRDHLRNEKAALGARIEVMKNAHSAILQKLRKGIEKLTGEKVDGWNLRNFIDEAIREAALEVVKKGGAR